MNPDKALTNQLQQESVTNPTQTLTPPQPSDPALAYQLATAVDKSILEEETPDVHQLFSYFNHTYFNNQLKNVKVKWSSSQMIKRAGSCKSRYVGSRHYCTITLSKPLLKLRPKKDMIETLLHEMIHAVLFITTKRITGHGPRFLSEAKRISEVTGFKIKVFHNFHKEVDFYLTHVWQCNGKCQGILKRSKNRFPKVYKDHQFTCGGTFIKIASQPPKPNKKKQKIFLNRRH